MEYFNQTTPHYSDWLRGWKEWARTRKRGKMAQFIIEKLEEGQQAKWLDISSGEFELTEWHSIAKEWFGEKPRNSEEVDAPCMLRKGLPRAFPGLEEVKERSRKEGTQYRSRVFKATPMLIQEVMMHITNHPSFAQQNGYNQYSTSTSTSGSSYPPHSLPNGVTANAFYNGSTGLAQAGVKIELPNAMVSQTSPPPPSAGYNMGGVDGEQFMAPLQYGGGTNMDSIAQAIAENSMDTTPYTGTGWSSSYPTPPSTGGARLSVPQSPATYISGGEDITGGLMGSPGATHQYNHSPTGSVHSPRISPEPSQPLTYPPSVYSTADQLSPPTVASDTSGGDTSEIMDIKAMPNRSPLEGGGSMAILFYKQLPRGRKVVYFLSRSNPQYYVGEPAIDENILTLSCQIPKYPFPEEVELCVYCENQPIASTTFTFYQQQVQMSLPPADMMLQILGTQLQTHFPSIGGASYGGNSDGTSTGGGSTQYSGSIPSSMYSLLLGACRLGCEPLVHCLMSSPVMEEISFEQLQEAHDCANNNGHTTLADHLSDMVLFHDSRVPTPIMVARGGENTQDTNKHVPAYYDALDQLDQGGDTPQDKASCVMKQLLTAMNMLKLDGDNKVNDGNTTEADADKTLVEERDDDDSYGSDATTPVVEVINNATHPLAPERSQRLSITTPTKLRRSSTSKLQHQPSVLDEDDSITDNTTLELLVPPPGQQHSRASLVESLDNVGDLPLPSSPRQHKLVSSQMSDADSAIGMSFEEDPYSVIFSEAQRRRSSLYTSDPVMKDMLSIKLTPEAGVEVANSLEWEGGIIVTEDFPPNADQKLFYKGDRICMVGDRIIRNKTADVTDFAEFFQIEAIKGTTIKIIPSMDKVVDTQESLPRSRPPPPRRVPSEQSMLDSLKSKVNSITTTRPLVSQRKVVISRAAYGSSFKMLGGKVTGVFISDVRSDVSETISTGDQILEVNGRSTDGLSLYEVNQLLLQTSSDINMVVVKNQHRFQHAREQLEVDSYYVRCLFDHNPTSHKEMTLRKGMLLRVINTSICAPNHWLAWSVDERTGVETQLKKIPTPSQAKKLYGHEIYEQVTRLERKQRPVCVVGPGSDAIAADIGAENSFTFCSSVMDVLRTCATGQGHAVYSVKDFESYQMLTPLQPIVLQTQPVDKIKVGDQLKYSNMKIDASLTTSDVKEAINTIHHEQTSTVWQMIGVIH